jgi:hypothetical protein
MSSFEPLSYDRIDSMVDTDAIALRDYAWAATREAERLTLLNSRLDADNAQLAGENLTLTEQLNAATLEQS